MSAKYIFEKTSETETLNKSLSALIQNSIVSSQAKSSQFNSWGIGITDDSFYMGNLAIDHVKILSIHNSTSYILSLPKKGAYSVKSVEEELKIVTGKQGALTLPSEKIIYNSVTEIVDDNIIIINAEVLNDALHKKYKVSTRNKTMLSLNLKDEKVNACFQFIESTLNMLHGFPSARNSELVKKNLKEISTFMLVDIIAENTNAELIINSNPEKHLVVKAEEIMEAECERLYTIQEVADKVYTSPRNLQLAFRKYRNYGPMQFLRISKLHKARKNILASKGKKCIVKQIAFEVGIFDLNRFGRNYAELFGELPSETIKKL